MSPGRWPCEFGQKRRRAKREDEEDDFVALLHFTYLKVEDMIADFWGFEDLLFSLLLGFPFSLGFSARLLRLGFLDRGGRDRRRGQVTKCRS